MPAPARRAGWSPSRGPSSGPCSRTSSRRRAAPRGWPCVSRSVPGSRREVFLRAVRDLVVVRLACDAGPRVVRSDALVARPDAPGDRLGLAFRFAADVGAGILLAVRVVRGLRIAGLSLAGHLLAELGFAHLRPSSSYGAARRPGSRWSDDARSRRAWRGGSLRFSGVARTARHRRSRQIDGQTRLDGGGRWIAPGSW